MTTTRPRQHAFEGPATAKGASPAATVGTGGARAAYAPIQQFLRDPGSGARGFSAGARLGPRARRDPQLLLAIAVAVPILILEWSGLTEDRAALAGGLAASAVFLGIQLWLTSLRAAPAWLPTSRLALSLAFVVLANVWADASGTLPLRSLLLPIVALAAARGGRGAALIVIVGLGTMLLPLVNPAVDLARRQSIVAVTLAAVVVALGSRSVVRNLEDSRERLQRANARDRRRARQLSAVEEVGRVLARQGPTADALGQVMLVLESTFGYRYPSVYAWDGQALQLGAQRNYRFPIQSMAPGVGVIGRVARTREAVFLPDVRSDPDFLSADPDVSGEIAIPLLVDDEFLGVLNVETSGARPLARDDFAIMQIVGDRLAAAMALGRERQKLTERAGLLERLTAFATVLGSSLDPATMDDEVAVGAAKVIPADSVVLVNRDAATGEYLINALAGGDPAAIGKAVSSGEGVTGKAIRARSVVVVDRLERAQFPKSVAAIDLPDTLVAMAAPMVIDDEVVGVVSWLRGDLSRAFTPQEREVAGLLAGKVGLALANARLHQKTQDAAITDPLTGLRNRRHFDATMEREDAVRRRVPAERRPLRSAILFDLDHFGQVNKRHGHQVGDRVLRLFADTLRAHTRASDLVARYGGEEFVVILENAGRDEALRIADDVRNAFANLHVEIADSEPVGTTVSAGCSTLEAWEIEGSHLLERADVALAMAKHAGRDQVVAA